MTIDRDQFKALATQFRDLQDSNKEGVDKFLEQVEAQGIDKGGLRRFVAWKRKDETKRAQQEAIDQQCRYLAGERDTPAELPVGCELAQAINLFRRNMTVQQVAAELRVSNGKAGKLRQLGQMFDVSIHAKVDGRRKPKVQVITPPEAAALPTGHDAKGNPLQGDADGVITEQNAAPQACEDGLSPVSTSFDGDTVPRPSEPQAAGGPIATVTPAPEGGEGTGNNSGIGKDDAERACGGVESRHALKANSGSVRADGNSPHDPAISGGSPVSVGPVYECDDRENSDVPPERSVNPVAAFKHPEAGEGGATTAQRIGAGVAPGPQDLSSLSALNEPTAASDVALPRVAGESSEAARGPSKPEVARAVPPAADPAKGDSSVEFVRGWQAAIQGDQRAGEPAPPEVNPANDLAEEKGDQPAGSAPATDPDHDDLTIPPFLRGTAVPGHAA